MKAHSGSSSDGFLPTLMSATGVAATAIAPEPQDPSATFANMLEQQEGASTAPLAEFASQLPLAPVALDPHTDPVLTAPAIATFFAPMTTSGVTPSTWTASTAATIPAGTSTSTSCDPVVTTTLSAPVSDDEAQTDLPHYIWLGQPKTPVAPTTDASLTTIDIASTEETDSTPTPIFTLPASARPLVSTSPTAATTTAPGPDNTTGTLLTLAQYLLLGQQPKASPVPVSVTTTTTSDTSMETDTNDGTPTDFALPHFTWPSQPNPTPTTTPITPPLTDNPHDLTGAALVASALKGAPAVPKKPAPQPVPQDATLAASARPTFTTPPLVTSMAHAAILAASNRDNPTSSAATTATDATSAAANLAIEKASIQWLAPAQLNGSTKSATALSGVEKKSAISTSERSSIPSKTDLGLATDITSTLVQAVWTASANVPVHQSVASTGVTGLRTLNSLATAPLGSAGTTNDKNQSDMTSTLDMQNFVSSGTHPLVTRTDADLHIQLGTNADFHHALDQVMHVAELSNLSRVTPPLRVAIEIQTPPGAIVNLYISRQPDSSYRAQLSTNDAQALGWVQQQVGSLKETSDSGTSIRWSPAQLESGSTATPGAGSSGSDRDLDWNRGGQQGQASYQQEERDSRRRPAYAQADEAESLGFFETISAIGGAA